MTRWRAQLLPADYGGRLDGVQVNVMVLALAAGVPEVVPFLISDVHTSDPEQFCGLVQELEIVEDGLDVILTADADAAEILRANRDLRAAAQIILGYRDEVGGSPAWAAVVMHVLATRTPLLRGLRGFEEIS